jgi:cell division protein FtsW (lipid II flippase)
MYSGGLWGEGFGAGNPEYTPIAESDFIYAVIGEELGFVGGALVMAFFLLIFLRGLQIAYRSRSSFGLLLAGGLTTVLATQTFLNIGGVTKFIPLTGITLPFISQGGSSLLTAFAILGLLLAISDGEPPGTRARARSSGPSPARSRAAKSPRAPARTRKVTPHTPPEGS